MSVDLYGFKWKDCVVMRAMEYKGHLCLEIIRNGYRHTVHISPSGRKVTATYNDRQGAKVLETLDSAKEKSK